MSVTASHAPPPSGTPEPPPETEAVVVPVGERGALTFRIAPADEREACFCLGVRKSGSTLVNRIVLQMARRNRMNVVDVPGTFFRSGYVVADWVAADLSAVVRKSNVYVGFRSCPTSFAAYPAFATSRKIFMFRDPRDALVSQYFSDAYSHSLPSRSTEAGRQASEAFLKKRQDALETDIDTYVLRHARGFHNTLMAYSGLLDDPTCLLLRYEDYVFQKKRLIHKILHHFGWTLMPGQIEKLLADVDQVPEGEDKTRFVRRVIPGDHRNKLGAETIRRLGHLLRDSLRLYDYY